MDIRTHGRTDIGRNVSVLKKCTVTKDPLSPSTVTVACGSMLRFQGTSEATKQMTKTMYVPIEEAVTEEVPC